MITRRTVLILGAGASFDYGFPLGRGLITSICQGLADRGSNFHKQIYNCGFQEELIGRFQDQLDNSYLPSIDAFLENRPEFEKIGKACIAASLIPHEDKERLKRDPSKVRWYEYLVARLIGRRDRFSDNRLSVITFNYDRSIDYALFLALRNSYGLKDAECREMMNTIPIVHVYGTLGKPGCLFDDGRPYEPRVAPPVINQCIASIRVVHEGTKTDPEFERAQDMIRKAEVVCFLGFGYHSENVKRLLLHDTLTGRAKRVYFSAYGFTERQVDRLRPTLITPEFQNSDRKAEFGKGNQDVLTFLQEFAVLE